MLTRDGGVPLLSHAYPGDRPDVTQFAGMIDEPAARHRDLSRAGSADPPGPSGPAGFSGSAELTVVFDAGQNSEPNFEHLTEAGLGYVGSLPRPTVTNCWPSRSATTSASTPSTGYTRSRSAPSMRWAAATAAC